MKLETIKKICKRTKDITIYESQYISNGECMVKLPNTMRANCGNIFDILSISEQEAEKYQLQWFPELPPLVEVTDYTDEEMLHTFPVMLHYQNYDLLALTDGIKVYFILVDYVRQMKPMNVRYALRGGSVSVFDGLLYLGTIETIDMSASGLKQIFSVLAERMQIPEPSDQVEFEEDE